MQTQNRQFDDRASAAVGFHTHWRSDSFGQMRSVTSQACTGFVGDWAAKASDSKYTRRLRGHRDESFGSSRTRVGVFVT
jgi:hypothetical protein